MTYQYYIKELLAGAHIRKMETYRLITDKKNIKVPVSIFNKIRHLLIENSKFKAYGITYYTHKDQQKDQGRESLPVIAGRVRPNSTRNRCYLPDPERLG